MSSDKAEVFLIGAVKLLAFVALLAMLASIFWGFYKQYANDQCFEKGFMISNVMFNGNIYCTLPIRGSYIRIPNE